MRCFHFSINQATRGRQFRFDKISVNIYFYVTCLVRVKMSELARIPQISDSESDGFAEGISEAGDILLEFGVVQIEGENTLYLVRKGWVFKSLNKKKKIIWHTRFPPESSYEKQTASGVPYLDPIKLKSITYAEGLPGTDWPVYNLARCPEFFSSKLVNARRVY
jgi:hypothetical protein